MNRDDVRKIFEDVKANHARLRSCAGPHDFEDITPASAVAKRYRCSLCRGELEGHHVIWYQRGLEDGKR